MAQPELQLPYRTPNQRYLNLAAVICGREFSSLEISPTDSSYRVWEPLDQSAFEIPIALKQIVLSHDPNKVPVFSVVKSQFHILGDRAMFFEVDNSDKSKEDPEVVEDTWSLELFKEFEASYLNHNHENCIASAEQVELARLDSTKKKLAALNIGSFKTTDKRNRY
jgi:hypothetical protein